MGRSVVDGVLRSTSVSAVKKFKSCPTQFFFRYVEGRPEPQGAGAKLGEEKHGELETFLTTGTNILSDIPRALTQLPGFPRPNDPENPSPWDLRIEQSFGEDGFELSAAGVPFMGFIDCIDPTMVARGVPTVRVIDWKFKKDIGRWGAKADDLVDPASEDGIQMLGYAVALANAVQKGLYPSTTHALLIHGQAQTARPHLAEFVSAEPIPFESAREKWATIDPVVEQMKKAAAAKSAEEVEGNVLACGKYGGCPHQSVCPHVVKQSNRSTLFKSLFGGSKQMGLLSNLSKSPAPSAPPPAPVAQTTPPKKPSLLMPQCEACGVDLNPENASQLGNGSWKHIGCGGKSAQPATHLPPPPVPTATASVLPPDAPAPSKAPAEEKPEKPKREKKAKAAAEPAPAAPVETTASVPTPGGFYIYVGCSPRKTKAQSLTPYVDELEKRALANAKEHLGVEADDIRLVTGSEIGFGKWKAVLGAMAKNSPPAAGAYYVLGLGMDERVDAVVAALEPIAADVVTR